MRRSFILGLAALTTFAFLSACSPHRVRKKAPKAKSKGVLSILEFKKGDCGCN